MSGTDKKKMIELMNRLFLSERNVNLFYQ